MARLYWRQHCKAHNRRGEPCQKWAIQGGSTCFTHGGAVQKTREAAQRRLEQLVMPAVAALHEIIEHADSDATRLAASRYVLEVNGFRVVQQVQAEGEVVVRVVRTEQPILNEWHRFENGHALDVPERN